MTPEIEFHTPSFEEMHAIELRARELRAKEFSRLMGRVGHWLRDALHLGHHGAPVAR